MSWTCCVFWHGWGRVPLVGDVHHRDRESVHRLVVHLRERHELRRAQDRLLQDQALAALGVRGEQVALRPDRAAQRHDLRGTEYVGFQVRRTQPDFRCCRVRCCYPRPCSGGSRWTRADVALAQGVDGRVRRLGEELVPTPGLCKVAVWA